MRYVRRFNRADIFDIEGIQCWLEEMSLQGLHIVRWGDFLSVFRKGEPHKLRYRLEPERSGASTIQMSLSAKEYYQEMGWTYVCTIGHALFHVLACEDENIPELYTDSNSLANAMKQTQKIARHRAIYNLLLIFIIAFASWNFWKDGISTNGILNNFTLFSYVFTLFYLPILAISLYQEYRFLQICHRLKRGRPIAKNSQKNQRLARIYSLSLIGFFVLSMIFTGVRFYAEKQSTFEPLDNITFDIPRLAEIEGRPEYVTDPFRENYSYYFHPSEGSYFADSQSILAPIQYTIVQSGRDNTVFWRDLLPDYHLNMRYYSVLKIELWETRNPVLTEKLLTEKISLPSPEKNVLQLNLSGYEESLMHVYSATASGDCPYVYYLFLQKGNRGACVYYYGAQDLREHLDLFVQMMEDDWEDS